MNAETNSFFKGTYMNKKLLLLFMAFCLQAQGCMLAKPELQDASGAEDMLCGILAVVGEQEAQRLHWEQQENETFHTLKELEESLAVSVQAEGIRGPERKITFEGVEGSLIGILKEEESEQPAVYFVHDGAFTEVKANTSATDEGTKNHISGVILAEPNLSEPVYLYPVYQRRDGSLYAVLETCGFRMGGVHDEGAVYAQTFNSRFTKEIHGKKETDSVEIEVSVKMAVPVEKISLLEYSEEHELLREREIPRGTLTAALQEETAYVMVEEKKEDGSTKRSIYDWAGRQEGAEIAHLVNYAGEDGLLMPESLAFSPTKSHVSLER